MTERFSEEEIVATVTRLTRSQLIYFINCELVRPELGFEGYVFRSVDIARLELLCDLSLDLELDEVALGVVISLLDQLHDARQDLATLTQAINTLPNGMRKQMVTSLQKSQATDKNH